MRFLFFLMTFFITLYADITLDFLKSKPKSIERDFYIWEFLKQPGITSKEVEEAYSLAEFKNGNYIYKQYMSITENKKAKQIDICKGTSGAALLKVEPWCADIGLTYARAISLDKKTQKELAKKLAKESPEKSKFLTFAATHSIKDIARVYPARFVEIFSKGGEKLRKSRLDLDLDKKIVDGFPRDYNFLNMVKIVTQNSYPALQKSLLKMDEKGGDRSDIQFYLAINAINHDDMQNAKRFLNSSLQIADKKSDKNKALFWLYLVENNSSRLDDICSNLNFDFYSLNAYELLGKQKECYRIETKLEATAKNSTAPITDPFFWTKMKEMSRDNNLSFEDVESLLTVETLPHYSFLKRKLDGYKNDHFILPYRDAFGVYEPKRQALLYSIAKQESLFMPSAVSHSFALGMMQIMPFNVEAIAKQRGEDTALTDMFMYKKNLVYSNHLVEWLDKRFKHPLFIAYAYNGGGGFTGRMLKGDIFKNGRFEPYLSMEMVPITESREYGKKVLANFVIYSQMLGVPTTMKEQISGLLN